MKKRKRSRSFTLTAALLAAGLLAGCSPGGDAVPTATPDTGIGSLFDAGTLFSERDLKQTAETDGAAALTAADGQVLQITEAGVYVLSGTASEASVRVEAGKDDKVQLVLDGLFITNSASPCIDVQRADKVFITTAGDSSLTVTLDCEGAILSRSDLVLSGTGKLTVSSGGSGIVGRDDVKITGGSYEIRAGSKAIAANDSIRIAGGSFTLTAGTDGLHAENDEDDSLGYLFIGGGDFTMDVGDDAIHARSAAQIEGGSFVINAAEGIEATYVLINGGSFSIRAWGDGINAGRKSSAYRPTVEINGGEITIVMAEGDTDGVDANGDIIINGGTVNVSGSSPFDYDGSAWLNGGTVVCNGRQVSVLPRQDDG